MNETPNSTADAVQKAHRDSIMRLDTDSFVRELQMMGTVLLRGLSNDDLIRLMCKHIDAIAKERNNLLHFFCPHNGDEVVKVDYHLVGISNSRIAWLKRMTQKLGGTVDVVKGPFVNPDVVEPWLHHLNEQVGFHRTHGIYADVKNADEVSDPEASG